MGVINGVHWGRVIGVSAEEAAAYLRWRSADHERGQGRVHLVEDGGEKTVCGHKLKQIGGGPVARGTEPTCRRCPALVASRKEAQEQRQEWEATAAAAERERQAALEAQRARYHAYLKTPEWRAKSRLVIERANGLCEGCRINAATQAHHLTYAHVGDEFLWELRAVCRECHERAHADRGALS